MAFTDPAPDSIGRPSDQLRHLFDRVVLSGKNSHLVKRAVHSLLDEKKYELTRLEQDIERAYRQIVDNERRRPLLEQEIDNLAKLQKVPHPRLARTQTAQLLELQETGLYGDIVCSQTRALVAYCNAPVEAELPDGMADWPAVRKRNGRAQPYAVRYFQIGNETWAFLSQLKKLMPERAEDTYVDCLVTYVGAMRAVDPSIGIIVDDLPGVAERVRERLGAKVQCLAVHSHLPWGIRKVTRDGRDVPVGTLTAADIWYAWIAAPRMDEGGLSAYGASTFQQARELGYKVAVTEWNWNG